MPSPSKWQIIAAFAAVYIIWGSTYLGIRFAIETMPPFLMAGIRFLIAGSLLFGWMLTRTDERPTLRQWRSAFIVGGLLLMGGNGGVTWAEQYVPSALAALVVAIVPLWVVLLDWLRPGGLRPGLPVFIGVLIGIGGIALLVGPDEFTPGEALEPIGIIALLAATICWASGTVYARHAQQPRSPFLTTGMQMLAGGVLLTLAGTLSGDWARLDVAAISARSWGAFIYLIFIGAIVAFTAYIWLLRVVPAPRVATYAYVNPVVAVFLGWAFAGETITGRTLVAAAVIIGSVVIINTYRYRRANG
ncbi:MAG: EamA family transporter [Anaerolineae bacterium]|nr:EamA family transporter [Anaerolineae bacterium]